MTCEFCDKSQMDVATYNIPNQGKFNSCTKCMRKIDNIILDAEKRFKIEIKIAINDLLINKDKI